MKAAFYSFIFCFTAATVTHAAISDPVEYFRSQVEIAEGDRIIKWECDLNGDGKNEVFLSLKSDFDKEVENFEVPTWDVYIALPTEGYVRSEGTEYERNVLSIDDLPRIDNESYHVGDIAELNAHGLVTQRVTTTRSGSFDARIYAFTVEGNHLKCQELTKYDPQETTPALYKEYLADDKASSVKPLEISVPPKESPEPAAPSDSAKDPPAGKEPPSIPPTETPVSNGKTPSSPPPITVPPVPSDNNEIGHEKEKRFFLPTSILLLLFIGAVVWKMMAANSGKRFP